MTPIKLIVCLFIFLGCIEHNNEQTKRVLKPRPAINDVKTSEKAKEALLYCQSKGLNTQYCLLADFSLHSGIKRLILWNFTNNKVEKTFMVSHGCGPNSWSRDESKEKPKFSNVDGSHCTSLGKYKLGERGWSDWGINVKYMMHGLEPGNKNAARRAIVFHSWNMVTDNEVYPEGTAEGWGCPAISNNSMLYLDKLIKSSNKNWLFWIY